MALRRRLALALLLASPAALAQTIDPTSCAFTLAPGETASVEIEVCVPGQENQADIYFLADNTESMGAVIDVVKNNASGLVGALLARTDVDIQIGIGHYRDIPPVSNPFSHQQDVTDDGLAIVAAIDAWSNGGGGDVAESQFYAMHRIATDATLGFRPGAKRILVWFGDSPAHDPICAPIVGLFEAPVEIDEASVIAELLAAGPAGGTSVIAISTPFSGQVPDGLDNDPIGPDRAFVVDYETILQCPQDGVAGQATRIADATGGLSTGIQSPEDIVDVILDSLASILTEVTVTVTPVGDIVPYVDVVLPDPLDLVLPQTPNEEVCGLVDVALVGQPCDGVAGPQVLVGGLEVRVNGQLIGTKEVVITQEECPGQIVSIDNPCGGSLGPVLLEADSDLLGGSIFTLKLSNALPNTFGVLLFGLFPADLIRAGCPLVFLPANNFSFLTDGAGELNVLWVWPQNVPGPVDVYMQGYVIDPFVPAGFSTSNTVVMTTPLAP